MYQVLLLNVLNTTIERPARADIECKSDVEVDLLSSAAGAIQSICYQKRGQRSLVSLGGLPTLLNMINLRKYTNLKVLSRAIGALHNLSSDTEAIQTIRRNGGIDMIIELLSFHENNRCEGGTKFTNESDISLRFSIVRSAAGTIQNVSREVASRDVVSSHDDALPLLLDILFGEDPHGQVLLHFPL